MEILLLVFLVVLILAVTWPWASGFATRFLSHWDPPFHAWKLNLVAESLLEGRVFPPGRTTNVFFPSSLTLYYEALHWPQAVLAAALRLFTGNLVLVYHVVMVLFWAFSGLCFRWLALELGASQVGSVLGAAIFVIMPFRISYIVEFNMQLCAGLLLTLLFLFRFLRDPGPLNALGGALGFWFQAASELYLALILLIVLPLLLAPSLRAFPWRRLRGRAGPGVVAALATGAALCWYFLWPYAVLHGSDDFSRNIDEMGHHFVEPLSYVSGLATRTLLPWLHRIRRDELDVYAGTLVLAGALLYAWSRRRVLAPAGGAGPERLPVAALRWVRLVAACAFAALVVGIDSLPRGAAAPWWAGWLCNELLLLPLAATLALALLTPPPDPAARARAGLAGAAAAAFLMSLGPTIVAANSGWSANNVAFQLAYRYVPALNGMRVVSRFAIVALIFLLVAAVEWWDALARRRPRALWTAGLVLLVAATESTAPLRRTLPFEAPWRDPAIAAMDVAPDAPVLVLPAGNRDWDGQYMLGIGANGRRMLFGWGGFFPPFQRNMVAAFDRGDLDEGLSMLRRVWPEPFVLFDRHRGVAKWGEDGSALIESRLSSACERLASDPQFVLLRARPEARAAEVHERITRRDVLAAAPTVVFAARSASGGELSAAVGVNGALLGRLALSGQSRLFALTVPPGALAEVYPNVVQIGSAGGGEVILESFALLPRGAAPAAAKVVPAEPGRQAAGPWPAWLGSVATLPAQARPALVEFRGGASLLGVEARPEQVRPGEAVRLTYYLGLDPGLSFAVEPHLKTRLESGGRLLAQDFFPATAGIDRPAIRVQPYRKVFRLERRLEVPADAAPGSATLEVSLHRGEDGGRAAGASRLPQHGRRFTLPVAIRILPPSP